MRVVSIVGTERSLELAGAVAVAAHAFLLVTPAMLAKAVVVVAYDQVVKVTAQVKSVVLCERLIGLGWNGDVVM